MSVSYNIFLWFFQIYYRLIVLISYYYDVIVPIFDLCFILGHAMPFRNINKREEVRMREREICITR